MNLQTLKIYAKVWLRLTALQFQQQVANARAAAAFLIFGKVFRFVTAFIFLFVIVSQAKVLAGYNLAQAVFVLALFNWGSSLTQLFFRGVYQFKQKVEDGTFDFYLLSPISELFYSLFSYTDPLDAMLMVPYTVVLGWAWINTGYPVTAVSIIVLMLSLVAMALFVFSVHVFILSIGVKYLEVDNTIMLYRDLERMAAYPIDIYGKYISPFLTYIIPFAVLATIPAKIIFGQINPMMLLIFVSLSLCETYLALRFWRYSLKDYTSASS